MIETRAKVGLAFLVVFLLGVAAGALSWSAYLHRVDPARQAVWTGRFNRERYVRELMEAVRLQPDRTDVYGRRLGQISLQGAV